MVNSHASGNMRPYETRARLSAGPVGIAAVYFSSVIVFFKVLPHASSL